MMKIGDRVRYTAQWLRSCGMYTGNICFAKGEIVEVRKCSRDFILAVVQWDNDYIPRVVNVGNLEIVK